MKKLLTVLLASFCSMLFILPVEAETLAFPGADGYARYTTGGRGGEVCYVTRLDDCSDSNLVEGTLRWAIRHDNGGKPRTILFATAGTIYLTSKLKLQYPDVSILGQSAPGGGITLTGYNMYICKDNVIVRYIRFRAGDIPNTSMTGLDLENAKNVILDHCSMTWSMEECLTAYDTDYTTVQWCIIGEGLYNSKNAKGARAYATQWGGEHSTMHHTLITNSHSRSPRFNGVRSPSNTKGEHDYQVDSEFANNVIFNGGGSYGGEYDASKVEVASWTKSDPGYNRVYMINNYFRPGPCSQGCNNKKFTAPSSPYGEWYMNGNKFDLTTDWSAAKTELSARNSNNYYNWGVSDSYKLSAIPYELSGLTYESAEEAYANVTAKAGASLPRYDEVDRRLLDEAAGTVAPKYHGATLPSQLGIIDSPDDITLSYPDSYVVNGVTYSNMPKMLFDSDKYAIDSDADGMPDAYEDEIGLNKNDASDGIALGSNGYTNLENYLNGIADGTIQKTKYETSAFMVEPGRTENPEEVTISYSWGSVTAEGTLPNSTTVAYGTSFQVPTNYGLYKEGYTLRGWQYNGALFVPGNSYVGTKDMTLTPFFEANKVQLSDRKEDLIISWDFTSTNAPSTVKGEGVSGIYVTQVTFSGEKHDVVIRYDNNIFTVPACKGGSVQLNDKDPVYINEDVDTYQMQGTTKRSALRTITTKLPYEWNTPDRIYYSPQPAAGQIFELLYTTPEMADNADWIGGSYYAYTQKRTFFDPEKDDSETYVFLDRSVVFNASDRTLDMFVTGTIKLNAYITNQSSNPNSVILIATPNDGGSSIQISGKELASKQMPEILELSGLDRTKSYRIRFIASENADIALGAIKLFAADASEISEGDASIEWTWAGTNSAPVQTPKGLFSSYNVTFSNLTEQGSVKDKNTTVKTYYGVRPTIADGATISFDFTPTNGIKFLPQAVSFATTRNGTGMGKYSVSIKQGDKAISLASDVDFIRDDNQVSHAVSYPVTGLTESSDSLTLIITINGANTAKDYGFADIKIEGRYMGTAPTATKYSISAAASPAEAGTISQSPSGTSLEKGTNIQVKATANAGFFFVNWTNQNNEVVSKTAVFNFTLEKNTQLTANFKSEADYSYIYENCSPFNAVVEDATSLSLALKQAAKSTESRYYIFLKNGNYDFGTTAKTAVPQNTSLIGESQDGVLIFNNPGSVTDYQNQTPVLFIDQNQNNVYMQDLTIRQSRDWEDKTSRGQAIALRQRGKQAIYKQVTIQGVQDTYYLNKADGTAYFEDCTLAGEVDFIYGDGTMFFQQCNLQPVSKAAYITAPNTQAGYKGIVFNQCTISKPADAKDEVTGYRLGRPWNDSPAATYINTTMQVLPADAGWGGMTSGLVLRFHEYGSKDSNGNELDLSKRSIAGCAGSATSDGPVLTDSQAAEYSLDKVFPSWNPANSTLQLEASNLGTANGTLNWQNVDGAIGYAIVLNGKVTAFTTDNSYSINEEGNYAIRPLNSMGGLGKTSNVVSASASAIEELTTYEKDPDSATYDLYGRKVQPTNGMFICRGKIFITK